MKQIAFLVAACVMLSACHQNQNNQIPAQSDAVKARQDLMQDWRAATEILKGMKENPSNFDVALLKEQTSFLQSSKSTMWTHFADSNAKGKAKEMVWSDPNAFSAATQNFDTAVDELNTVAQQATSMDDVEVALAKVGESCGGCHKVFKD